MNATSSAIGLVALLGSGLTVGLGSGLGCDSNENGTAAVAVAEAVSLPPAPPEAPEPWTDAWLVAESTRYLEDASFRREVLEQSLTSHENIYAKTRLSAYGLSQGGWDALPEWIPRQALVDTELVAGLRRGEALVLPADATPLWDQTRPQTYAAWVALGRKVFFGYPLRPEVFAEHALAVPLVAAEVGVHEASNGTWPGMVAFADIDGETKIGITCALCHVAVHGGEMAEGEARRDFDYGQMRLAYYRAKNLPLADDLRRRMAGWGPGRADITQDDDEDPVEIPDLWNIRGNRYLTQAATLTHSDPAALAIRQETQILHTNLERTRPPRELAWALAMYVYSLQPPAREVTAATDATRRGRALFDDHCTHCHSDENGGGAPVPVARVQVNPSLAQGKARGTGLYRPSPLIRVGDAAPYFHDGVLASLEDVFSEERFSPDYENVRGTGAVVGHRFGVGLAAEDQAALIAYLRTL